MWAACSCLYYSGPLEEMKLVSMVTIFLAIELCCVEDSAMCTSVWHLTGAGRYY